MVKKTQSIEGKNPTQPFHILTGSSHISFAIKQNKKNIHSILMQVISCPGWKPPMYVVNRTFAKRIVVNRTLVERRVLNRTLVERTVLNRTQLNKTEEQNQPDLNRTVYKRTEEQHNAGARLSSVKYTQLQGTA